MENRAFDFNNKIAFITGASRGIGAAIAIALSRLGARCVLNFLDDATGRNHADVDAAVKKAGNGSIAMPGDISQFEAVQQMATAVVREFGGIDLLINNAGILRDRSLRKMSRQDFDDVISVNLGGAFNVIKSFQEHIRPGGRVVNMASVAATLGFFGQANYAPSKAGVIALTKVAARELAKQQITVNAIAPGVVKTEMTKDLSPQTNDAFLSKIPLGRLGEVDDIVDVALFLCSDMARYITGQVIHVDGGFFMGGA